ncbi:MAG TPA: right-handed parallel beta-helix repeat-containing protein [Pyrinomonadaceae bacterium]|nr:right-handed parallel beta-helix repeat-containing protein [Pyrinomonadaceae bacterium]
MKRSLVLLLALPVPVVAALVVFHFRGAAPQGSEQSVRGGPTPNLASVPGAQAITSLTVSPAAAVGGDSSIATITLRYPAEAGGAVISLSTEGPAITHAPKSVTVPAGQRSVSFAVTTERVAAQTTASLRASYASATQAERLTLLPPERPGWYVAPDGSARGRGTKDSPWDLATALAGRKEIKPGDTVWLGGGRYAGAFTSTLEGALDAPVIVRAAPNERVTIDRAGVSESKQPALKVKGAHVWFWGMEITNSNTDRSRKSPYEGRDEPWRGSGADVYAPGVKFINMVFHDNGHGVWDKQDGTEITGCLFFYNGNNKREHGLYVGNSAGTKYITDNVLFAQGGYGILAHSDSPKSAQKGIHLEGNVSFDNGALTLDDQTTGNIQVGGVEGVSAERIVLKNNYVYNSPGSAAAKNNGIRLGYEDKNNRDVKVLDNYIVSSRPLRLWWWQSVEFLGNTIYSQNEALDLLTAQGATTAAYRWDFNTYFSGGRRGLSFVRGEDAYDFARWREATRLDAHSQLVQRDNLRPEGTAVFLRPNRYEAGRANVVVYNWELRDEVAVDFGTILPKGAGYEVRDAQNYFGEPVAAGTYDGAPVRLPMKLKQVSTPVGRVERAPGHTSPEFAVFILRQISKPNNKPGAESLKSGAKVGE